LFGGAILTEGKPAQLGVGTGFRGTREPGEPQFPPIYVTELGAILCLCFVLISKLSREHPAGEENEMLLQLSYTYIHAVQF
jgi:hypothetical protein